MITESGPQNPNKIEIDALRCPISYELMTDPVITPYGHCFQRTGIEDWLKTHNSCPLTNQPLSINQLIPCFTVKSAVEELLRLHQADISSYEEEKKEISMPILYLPQVYITYGIPIKLKHVNTNNILHSHPINYRNGSHQQEVTCFFHRDNNDWWIIKGPNGRNRWNTYIGTPVQNLSIIRLEHLLTGRNLHSHNIKTSESKQQEVSCYGQYGIGDDNDNWRLEIENGKAGDLLGKNCYIRLIHVQTGQALHSHENFKTKSSQQEVTAHDGRDTNDLWVVDVIA
ncbi:unnamed protein product [Blepharisma stoltei]|uniref:U-box domain-containing protein n=1 Tax=Blepharisma stoltei TaxID=1481888 RepID=A0AAU9JF54_9CILI|nr:unnamed protein product [Blepharisma stoltei]